MLADADPLLNPTAADWELLATLTEADLDAIQAHTGRVMPPGHRKKLLMASRQMGATYGHAHGHGPYDGGPAWAGSSTSGVLVAQAGRQLTPSSSFGAMRTGQLCSCTLTLQLVYEGASHMENEAHHTVVW